MDMLSGGAQYLLVEEKTQIQFTWEETTGLPKVNWGTFSLTDDSGIRTRVDREDLSFNKSTAHDPEYCYHQYNCDLYQSSNAVDRVNSTCTRNSPIGRNFFYESVWWRVDLGDTYNVYNVIILFKDYGEARVSRQRGRFAGFSIYLSNSSRKEAGILCYKNGQELPPLEFTTTCTGLGRYVFFYNERLRNVTYPDGYETYTYTELCEVLVQGCTRTGFYGDKCKLPCPENCLERKCNIGNGTCMDCKIGWTGKFCTERCRFGSYGLKCQSMCAGLCKDNVSCNHVTGGCDDGCAAGRSGIFCEKECDVGKYGLNCIHSCSGYCMDDTPCDKENGRCETGCIPGYMGDVCDQRCPLGLYGIECQSLCLGLCKDNASCNHVTGGCDDGCAAGWSGTFCEKECDMGKYGPNCIHSCSGYCMGGTPCNKGNGRCETGCIPGYMGDVCDQKCLPGSYGMNCQYRCSGHCVNDEICNGYDGSCSRGCQEPYIGLACDFYHDTSTSDSTIALAVLVSLIGTVLICVGTILIRQKYGKTPETVKEVTVNETFSNSETSVTDEPQSYEELSMSGNWNAYQDLNAPEIMNVYQNLEFAA